MKTTFPLAALLFTALTGTALADSDYKLVVDTPAAKAGAKAVAKVKVQPKGKYHINQDFPTKLTIAAPSGIALEKVKQTSKDAVKFEDGGAEFEVAFTPKRPGTKAFSGELRFAVCEGDRACVPKTAEISFSVTVE